MRTPALVVEKPGDPFLLQDVELDESLREDEVQVRLAATGVCHTDINFSKEETMPELFPGILGHEGAGIVERIGSAVNMVEYNFGIGRLDGSKAFRSFDTGKRITSHFFGQSSFAKYTVLKETGCVKVPNDLPFDRLAPLGCGFMTGAGAMLNVVQPELDDSVVVVGAGAVGLAAIMACKLLEHPPRRIIAVDIVPSRLELARHFGATHGVNSKIRTDLMKVLMDITDGQGVNGSIDTTGRPEVLKSLVHSTARKGKVVSVGVGQLTAETSINIFEIVLAGCMYVGCNEGNCYPPEFLPRLLEANKQGKFPYDQLIKTYPAKDVGKAVEDIKNGNTVKAVLLWD